MGKRFRDDTSLRLSLNAVIADRRGRPQTFLGVTRFEQSALGRIVTPHASVAVRLELLPDGKRVSFALAAALSGGRHTF